MKSSSYLLFVLLMFQSFNAATIHVGVNYPVKKIKQALILAKKGDTIIVNKGIYKEGNIIIDKKIIFLGKDFPILDGQFKNEVLSVKADSVIVEGLDRKSVV